MPEVKRRLNSQILSSVRGAGAAGRLGEIQNEKSKGSSVLPRIPSAIVCIDTGYQTTIGGCGPLFQQFKRNQPLSYTGMGQVPKKVTDELFHDADLREVSFRDTFDLQNYDVTKSKFSHVCQHM